MVIVAIVVLEYLAIQDIVDQVLVVIQVFLEFQDLAVFQDIAEYQAQLQLLLMQELNLVLLLDKLYLQLLMLLVI